ncbi:type VII secretion integral membrane protein EccD [Corynebacterium sp. ES2775-CONJ]|uniref:type VII secretion integral membrane protein EccD n=1 Tax=Corynebacterium sp. ES2775-CONJ TaxID=2974029 RepID=UPI0021699C21|nr:type VII secretion integral membrane protein EccD [Corynebacterium sp. ES2775-CONJ]MCS4489588.1 type VII secretion integral membrane protein EccD [Corynebacterium sp. ES2775-CONJ]
MNSSLRDTESIRSFIRIELGDNPQHIDLYLPGSSSLSDMMAEIFHLAHIHSHPGRYQVLTAAGIILDMHAPLKSLGLSHGDVMIIRNATATPPPLVRDAAESLAAAAPKELRTAHTPTFAAVSGAASLVGGAFLLPLPIPLAVTLLLVAGIFGSMSIWAKLHIAIPLISLLTAVSALIAVGGSELLLSPDLLVEGITATDFARGWALSLAAAALTVVVVATVMQLLIPARGYVVFTVAYALGIFSLGLGGLLYSPGILVSLNPTMVWLGHGLSVSIVVMVIMLAAGPQILAKIAGLRVPLLPTIGQPLDIADKDYEESPLRTRHARTMYSGMLIAIGSWLSLATLGLLILGLREILDLSIFHFWLIFALSLALILHAHRHRFSLEIWALWIPAHLAGFALLPLAALLSSTSLSIVALIFALMMVAAPSMADKISTLEPTVVVWLERIELLALAAIFPLALQTAGLFSLLRGLAL